MHVFTNSITGSKPIGAVRVAGGTLYGVTAEGGTADHGTVFALGTDGTGFRVLHNFTGSSVDGSIPTGAPVVTGSTIYGLTARGGASATLGYDMGVLYRLYTDGSGYTNLYNFGGVGVGASPFGSLAQAGTKFYGMTGSAGGHALGAVFQINIDGSGYTNIHSFAGGLNDGNSPLGSVVLSNSTLYGMTMAGGVSNAGVVFSLTLSAPVITTPGIATTSLLPAGTVGQSYAVMLDATNGAPPYVWSVSSGTLPAGLAVDASGGSITGLPTVAKTSSFTLRVTDANQRTATKNFSITIAPATGVVAMPGFMPPAGTFLDSVAVTLNCATAGATVRYTTDGSEPTAKSKAYAKTAITLANTTTLKAKAFKGKDSSQTAAASYTIQHPPLCIVISTPTLPAAALKAKYSTALHAQGGIPTISNGQPTYKWSWTASAHSTLPAGLSLNAATGVISGKPTKTGTFLFIVKITDSKKATASQAFILTVNP